MRAAGVDLTGFLPSVAAKLAELGDEEQAAFFNTFARELIYTCGARTQAELQAAWIREKLDDDGRFVFEMLGYREN